MAVFEFTDPDSGLTIDIEGDEPPTESELDEIFSQLKAEQQLSLADNQTSQQDPNFIQQAQHRLGRGISKAFREKSSSAQR